MGLIVVEPLMFVSLYVGYDISVDVPRTPVAIKFFFQNAKHLLIKEMYTEKKAAIYFGVMYTDKCVI